MNDEPAETAAKSPWWQQVDWTGAVAFVLALGISISMTACMLAAMTAVVLYERPISEQGAAMLSTIFGAAIGALATYMGQSRERQIQNRDKK